MKERYRRRLEGMASRPPPGEREWSVYLVRCADDSLYTGIAKNVEARLARHNKGKGAAYTRTRRPVALVHEEGRFTRSEALIREAAIKRLPRPRKAALSAGRRRTRRRTKPRDAS